MGHVQTAPCPDAIPPKAMADKKANMVDTLELKEFNDLFDEDYSYLIIENLNKVLEKYEVKFQKIVMAQALLETGHFTSPLCLKTQNIPTR